MATDPVEEHGADGPLKSVDGRHAFVGEEGGSEPRIGHEFGVAMVLL
jgi:hypothetical protein